MRRLGIPAEQRVHKVNGCRLPFRVRRLQGYLRRQGDNLVMAYFS
jgi:hypothetical protein